MTIFTIMSLLVDVALMGRVAISAIHLRAIHNNYHHTNPLRCADFGHLRVVALFDKARHRIKWNCDGWILLTMIP